MATRWIVRSAVIVMSLPLPGLAIAGPLGSTTQTIGQRTGSSSSGGGSSSSGSSSQSGSGHSGHFSDEGSAVSVWRPRTGDSAPAEFDLFVGVQSVKDSDYAGDVFARVHYGPAGMAFTGSHYVEHLPSEKLGDPIRMNLWSFTFEGRVVSTANQRTQVWLRAGIAGAGSTNFEHIFGPVAGVEASHGVTDGLRLRAAVRQFWFEYDLVAREYRAELTASILSLGYRVLRFDVGVPLHGPMVGIRTNF